MKPTIIEIKNGLIHVYSDFSKKDVLKSIPGAMWDRDKKCWTYPATPVGALEIKTALGPNGTTGRPVNFMDLVTKADIAQNLIHKEDTQNYLAENRPLPRSRLKPYVKQRAGTELIHTLPGSMIAFEMGGGKTKCVIDWMNNWDFKTALVVCPKSVIQNWGREWEKHGLKVVNLVMLQEKSLRDRAKTAEQYINIASFNRPTIIVTNYEAVWQNQMGKLVQSIKWGIIVADEVHKLKAPNGRISKFMAKLDAHRKVGLTGTPLPHSPLDAFGQFRFIDPAVFGHSFPRFRNRYAIMGGFQGYEVKGFQRLEELHDRMYKVAIRAKKSEFVDLPSVTCTDIPITLSDSVREVYDTMEAHLIAEVQKKVVTAKNALTKLLRLQQITSGYVKAEDGTIEQIEQNGKSQALAEYLDSIDPAEPVVVFCRFRNDLDVIAKTAGESGRTCWEISGRMNELNSWEMEVDSLNHCLAQIEGPEEQARLKNAPVLAVQMQAGGLGIDLSRSCYGCFFSLTWSLGEYEQVKARLDRPGQTKPVTFTHLVAQNTVDEKIFFALMKRKSTVDMVIDEWLAMPGMKELAKT